MQSATVSKLRESITELRAKICGLEDRLESEENNVTEKQRGRLLVELEESREHLEDVKNYLEQARSTMSFFNAQMAKFG
jgi:hypothetical protein